MEELEKGILEIHMLGGFTLNYNGREIVLGRSSTSKFIQLLQLVWLQGKRGIAKEQLMKNLSDRESVTNLHNSFNNLIYRMRQQMPRAGLPEGDYIYCKNGLYYADESFPVWVDVVEFENLIQSAKASEDEKEKLDCFDRAASLYRGELLKGTPETEDGYEWKVFPIVDGKQISEAELEERLKKDNPDAEIYHFKSDVSAKDGAKGYSDANYTLTVTVQTAQLTKDAIADTFKEIQLGENGNPSELTECKWFTEE